jgi:hypothetical protein
MRDFTISGASWMLASKVGSIIRVASRGAFDVHDGLELTKQLIRLAAQLLRFFPSINTWRVHPLIDRVHKPRRDLFLGCTRPCISNAPLLVQDLISGADCHLAILPKAATPVWRGTGAAS